MFFVGLSVASPLDFGSCLDVFRDRSFHAEVNVGSNTMVQVGTVKEFQSQFDSSLIEFCQRVAHLHMRLQPLQLLFLYVPNFLSSLRLLTSSHSC